MIDLIKQFGGRRPQGAEGLQAVKELFLTHIKITTAPSSDLN